MCFTLFRFEMIPFQGEELQAPGVREGGRQVELDELLEWVVVQQHQEGNTEATYCW